MSIKKTFAAALVCAAAAMAAFGQAVEPCTQNTQLTGGTEINLNQDSQQMGTISGTPYHFEIWVDQGKAQGAKLKLYGAGEGGGGAFRADWDNNNDYLGRVGYYWGNGGPYTQYKNIYADFNYKRSDNGTGGNYSYIGIYGWGRNPSASQDNLKLIEYYIIDDWYSAGQLGTSTMCGGQNCQKFTYEMDGGTYNFYTNIRDQKPSIDGTKTFTQYFAVRQGMTSAANSRRTCGTYSITEHFKKWDAEGYKLGNMYEAKFLVEAASDKGWFDMTYLSFSQEETPRGSVSPGNYSLVTYVSPANSGCEVNRSSNPAGGYAPNAKVTLTAAPKTGWKFVEWSGGHTGSTSPVEITMNENKVITAVFEPVGDGTTNLIVDGNFPNGNVIGTSQGAASWTLGQGEHWGNSSATTSVSGNSVTINISSKGAEAYQPQLVQYNIPLDKGMSYKLTFTAKAVAARDIELSFQQAASPWSTYASKTISLTTSSDDYEMVFKMDSASDPSAQFAFNLGQSTENVTISNVKLVYTGSTSISDKNIPKQNVKKSSLKVTAKKSAINVKFKAKHTGATELHVYGLKGDLVAKTKLQTVAGKGYSHTFNTGRLANGFYVVSMRNGAVLEQSRVIIPR